LRPPTNVYVSLSLSLSLSLCVGWGAGGRLRLCVDLFAVSLDLQQRLVDDGVPLPSPDRRAAPVAGWRVYYQRRHAALAALPADDGLVRVYGDLQGHLERYVAPRPGLAGKASH
jgi:hypothetical protein